MNIPSKAMKWLLGLQCPHCFSWAFAKSVNIRQTKIYEYRYEQTKSLPFQMRISEEQYTDLEFYLRQNIDEWIRKSNFRLISADLEKNKRQAGFLLEDMLKVYEKFTFSVRDSCRI